MTTKTKRPARVAAPPPTAQALPFTIEERLHHIEAIGQHINEYVKFMCQLGNSNATSSEAKETAVNTFYEQMVIVERQLGRIHDAFQLE